MDVNGISTEIIARALAECSDSPSTSDLVAEIELQQKIDKHHIWKGEGNNKWCAYVKVDGKRKLIAKNDRSVLMKELRKYYSKEYSPYFAAAYKEMLAEKEEDLKKNSITRYNNDFNRFCKSSSHAFMKTRVNAMTDGIIEDFILACIRKFKLSNKSYAGLRTIIRETLRYAKRKGYTDYSVVTFFNDLSIPATTFRHKKTTKEKIFTTKEIQTLRKACSKEKKPAYKVILLMTYTGLRVGEAVALKPSDLKGDYLSITKTEITYREKGHQKTEISDSAKLGHDREIPVIKEVKSLMKSAPFDVTTRQVRYALDKICADEHLPKMHPHSIRKWFISYLLESKEFGEAEVQALVGHTDIMTTRAYYHKDISEEGHSLKALSSLLSKKITKS